MESANGSPGQHPANLKCIVCGSEMYSTDRGNHELTYHCSSPAARFWDYDRGTPEQTSSKEHWDKSRVEIFS